MKTKLYLIAAILLLLAGLAITWNLYRTERKERIRTENNSHALMEQNEAYKTKEGQWALDGQILTLTKAEFAKYKADAARQIESQGVKIKRLEAVISNHTQMVIEVEVPVRDTVFVRDSVAIAAQTFNWHNDWTNLDILIAPTREDLTKKKAYVNMQNRDSLIQYVYRVPKRFLFIKYGTKEIRQTIISSNPNTKIEYSEYVKFSK